MAIYTILCGQCGTSAGAHQNAQPNDEIRCRNCGQTDTYFAMIASAQSFVTDQFAQGELPDRQYRWVVAGFERDR